MNFFAGAEKIKIPLEKKFYCGILYRIILNNLRQGVALRLLQ
jgi:hypothetical protein